MRRLVAGLALACLLVACGQADQNATSPSSGEGYASGGMAQGVAEMDRAREEAAEAPPAAPPPPPMPTDAAQQQPGQTTQPPQPPQPAGGGTTSPILYLAYSYAMGLEVPGQRLTGVMDRHIQACQTAGPRLCQLINSNRSGDPEAYIEGYVSLRGEPAWLRNFMGGIGQEIDEADGRIMSETTNTEDLTRQIVDTEARMRALTSLRNRLQELLRSRPGRLADLLEVERELARVQGELDATQSNLAVMRTRVSMSELTLSYRSAPRPVGSDTFEPLRNAFASFLGIIVAGFAAIITIIAGLIPIAVVVIPIVWLLMRWRRARGRFFNRHRPSEAPPPAETPT